MSEDPIGFAGGDVNQYAYVGNNPLNFKDPSGLFPTAGEIADGLDGLVNRGKRALNADYDTFGWYGKFGIDYYVGASTDVLKLIYDPLKLGRGFACAFYGEGVPWWQRGFMVIGDIGRTFAIAGAVSSVVSKVAGLVGGDTALLQAHVTRAANEVDSLGDAAFTPGQLNALQKNPNLRPAFRGNRIDVMAREAIEADPKLSHVTSNYSRGPDFLNPKNGNWWDMTTPGQWQKHVDKYGTNGTLLSTK